MIQSPPEESQTTSVVKRKRVPKRSQPFTPWQILVDDRRRLLKLSFRALADKIASPRQKYDHTTVWAWLCSPEGTPPGNAYSKDLNRRLASALELKEDILAAAFEESRRKFVLSSATPAQLGQLSTLRMLIVESHRERWDRQELVKIIDDIQGN